MSDVFAHDERTVMASKILGVIPEDWREREATPDARAAVAEAIARLQAVLVRLREEGCA